MAAGRSERLTQAGSPVVYWDSSAILSVLFHDRHSGTATTQARRAALHLLSSLAWAEVHAVISRMQRARILTKALAETTRNALGDGPWRRVNVLPDWRLTRSLATRWPLRGADLWQLGAAKTLKVDLPELVVLSFDDRIRDAARGEGLA